MTTDPVPDWTPSSPSSIDVDLRHLWETAARQSPVSRALMSNLVIVSDGEPAAEGKDGRDRDAERMLPAVARRHPARVVLLNHRCTPHAREPQNVRVGLLIFGPPEQRYGIEVIAVAVACLDDSLPSILRALTRGDVPTTLWLTGDTSVAMPARPLVEISRQMIYDSSSWKNLRRGFEGVAGLLDASHPPAVVDLAWRRLAPMRRAVATALEPLRFEQRPRAEQMTITAPGGRAADAWLMWGWLRTRLDWVATPPTDIAEGDHFDLHFQGQGWSANVRQAVTPGKEPGQAAIAVSDTAGRAVTVSPAQENVAEALGDELTSLAHDFTLERTVQAVAGGQATTQ